MTTTPVYLDCMSDQDAREYGGLALQAVELRHRWNGFESPVVSASEFSRFISMVASVDPNGTWSPAGIAEGDGALIYEDEVARDVWSVVGVIDGTPVYELNGWQWVL